MGLRLAVASVVVHSLSLICSFVHSLPSGSQVLELKVKWEILESVLASTTGDGKVAWRAFLQQYNAEYASTTLGEGKDAKVDDDEGGRG